MIPRRPDIVIAPSRSPILTNGFKAWSNRQIARWGRTSFYEWGGPHALLAANQPITPAGRVSGLKLESRLSDIEGQLRLLPFRDLYHDCPHERMPTTRCSCPRHRLQNDRSTRASRC